MRVQFYGGLTRYELEVSIIQFERYIRKPAWPNKALHATPVGRCGFVEKILVFGCHKSGVRELFSLASLSSTSA